MTNLSDVMSRPLCWKSGKVSYSTRVYAKRAKRAIERRADVNFGVYRCQHCKMYHLTTQKERDDTRNY